MVFIIRIIFYYIIFYLLIRLVTVLMHKGKMYVRAYREVQRRKREQSVRASQDNLNLRAFDVEDAHYEEIKGGGKKE